MRAAVVGAGFAGLAVTWFLLQKGIETTVFYENEGASYASTGLLHPAPGKRARESWRAKEGIQETLQLLKALGKPVFEQNGILRIAHTDEQRSLFGGDSILIPDGITVYSRMYLQELKKACSRAKFIQHKITQIQELEPFDRAILTMGAESVVPVKKTIGQSLICRWKERLPMSLLSDCHITPTEDPEFCQIGSTYEHTEKPDPQKALALLDKAARIYPPAKEFKIVEIRTGVRASPKMGHQPVFAKIGPKYWVFTGLGSRGLMYHALLAKKLVMMIQ